MEKISFGWNLKTHSYITKKAYNKASKLANLKLDKKILSNYSKMPDMDQVQNLNEWHFFDPFAKYIKGEKNSEILFTKHLQKAIKKALEQDEKKASKHLGRALHYLQDIFMPLHAQKLSTKKKLNQLKIHTSFENKAQVVQKEIIDTSKNIFIDETISFEDFSSKLIKQKALISKKRIDNTLSSDFDKVYDVIKLSLQDAFESSYELIYRFSKKVFN